MDAKIINCPDGSSLEVDMDAVRQVMPPDVWAGTLEHIQKHGLMGRLPDPPKELREYEIGQ